LEGDEGGVLEVREDRDDRLARERGRPGEALVEDGADREDVGRRSGGARVARLLRGHVARGPREGTLAGERDAPARPRRVDREVLREPQVGDEGPRVALLREEDVLGLEVAVDDAERVRPAERSGEGAPERERRRDVERTAAEPVAQGAA